MCGICCVVSLSAYLPEECLLKEDVLCNIRRRGPNSSQQLVKAVLKTPYQCLFSGHVLHLRGPLTPQPVEDPTTGNVFLWNGEVFGGIPIEAEENDTQVIFRQLCSCSSESAILSVLSSIHGPWSFIFYQASKHHLWFGRDYFGRRSLLWQFNKDLDKVFLLTSVSASSETDGQWQEVPASGIFRIDLQLCATYKAITLLLHPWKYSGRVIETEEAPISYQNPIPKDLPTHVSLVMNDSHSLIIPVVPLNKEILEGPGESHFFDFTSSIPNVGDLQKFLAEPRKKTLVQQFIDVLSRAVKRRVLCLVRDADQLRGEMLALRKPHVAILFSGGIDSMMIATLADRHVPSEEPIDLLNVAFKIADQGKSMRKCSKQKKALPTTQESLSDIDVLTGGSLSCFNVPDRITGRAGLEELKAINPSRSWNFVEINVTLEDLKEMRQQRISRLVYPLDTVLDDSIGCAVWFASRGDGLLMCQGDMRPYKSPAKV